MCSIAGFWRPERSAATAILPALVRMTKSLAHRGPDADGHWIDLESGVALGHRRLAIVDLSPTGAQPMHSASRRFTIVFNRAISNFPRFRRKRAAVGPPFAG